MKNDVKRRTVIGNFMFKTEMMTKAMVTDCNFNLQFIFLKMALNTKPHLYTVNGMKLALLTRDAPNHQSHTKHYRKMNVTEKQLPRYNSTGWKNRGK